LTVVDASALVAFLFDSRAHPRVEESIRGDRGQAAVPHLCDLEVTSAVRSMVQRRHSALRDAPERLALYRELPLERFDHLPLLDRVWALRDNFTPYDAVYVALAEALRAPFLTADARLADAVSRFTGVEALLT